MMLIQKHEFLCRLLPLLCAGTLLLTIGCASKPKSSHWPQSGFTSAYVPPGADPGMPPGQFDFYGDDPRYDNAPFENRTTINVSRHSDTFSGLDFDPDLHPDATEIVFASTRHAPRPDIYIKSTGGAAFMQVTADPADDIQPRFSPDGEQIAFASNRAGSWDIWVVNRDGTQLRQLTDDPGDEIAPTWSPDSGQIAFTSWSPRARRWEIWTLPTMQPGVRRFLTYGMFPSWSPDGQRIAFQRARQRGSRWFSVWTVELVDDEARYPTEIAYRPGAACIAPRWSPDGSQIVYCVVNETPPPADAPEDTPSRLNADVWIASIVDETSYKLTDGAMPSFNPTWSRDGRVYFVAALDGRENIYSVAPPRDSAVALSARADDTNSDVQP